LGGQVGAFGPTDGLAARNHLLPLRVLPLWRLPVLSWLPGHMHMCQGRHEPSDGGGVQLIEQHPAPRSVLTVTGSIMPDPTGHNRPMSRNRVYPPYELKSQAQ
jgi:hypothetical protein